MPQALAFALVNADERCSRPYCYAAVVALPFTLSNLRETMRFGLFAVIVASMSAAVVGVWVHVSIAAGKNCNGEAIPANASFGIAERTPEDKDIRALLIRADTALYTAENSGRNRGVCAEAPLAVSATA